MSFSLSLSRQFQIWKLSCQVYVRTSRGPTASISNSWQRWRCFGRKKSKGRSWTRRQPWTASAPTWSASEATLRGATSRRRMLLRKRWVNSRMGGWEGGWGRGVTYGQFPIGCCLYKLPCISLFPVWKGCIPVTIQLHKK